MGRAGVFALVRIGVFALVPIGAAPLSAEEPPLAGWVEDEGFRLRSPDGNWRLRLGLQVAPHYQPLFQPGGNDWANFGFLYARPYLSGTFFRPWIDFFCAVELREFPPLLLECQLGARPWRFFGVRGGQLGTALSRHQNQPPSDVLFPDRATTSDYFWTGRDRGVRLLGETRYLEYDATFTAGSSLTQTVSTPGHFQVLARLTVSPLGPLAPTEMPWAAGAEEVPLRLSLAASGGYGRVNPNRIGFNADAFLQLFQQGERSQGVAALDLVVQWSRLGFVGEGYVRHVAPREPPTAPFVQLGAWAQAHVTFFRRLLDAAVRFDWIEPSRHLAHDRFLAGEAQLAWFVERTTLALRLRYGLAHQDDPGPAPPGDPQLLTTVGLPIAPGWLHLLTLQVQLAL